MVKSYHEAAVRQMNFENKNTKKDEDDYLKQQRIDRYLERRAFPDGEK